MTTRKLDNSGLEILALIFGGNIFGWTADESTPSRLLDALLDASLSCIDAADVYSRWVPGHQSGELETLIGKWLKRTGKHDRTVIVSKVRMDMGNGHKGLSATYIEQTLERSLRRLQTDYLDLYQSHTDDPHTDLEETLSTYGEPTEKDKVWVIGVSNYDVRRPLEARQVSAWPNLPSHQSLQPEYNLHDRADYETSLEPTVEELGIGVISYYPLASGFLSGKYRNQADTAGRTRGEKVKGYLNERGVAILAVLDEAAEQYSANPTQVALAWLIARPVVTTPIASAISLEQLDDLIAAIHLKLDKQAIHRLNNASAYWPTCRRGRPRPVEWSG